NDFVNNGNHIIADYLDDDTNFVITNNIFGASDGSKIAVDSTAASVDLENELGLSGNTFSPDTARLSYFSYVSGPQTVYGTSGADNFRDDFSNPGNHTYIGRGGDDNYYVDSGDTVTETAGGGTDSVFTYDNYTLSAEVEN